MYSLHRNGKDCINFNIISRENIFTQYNQFNYIFKTIFKNYIIKKHFFKYIYVCMHIYHIMCQFNKDPSVKKRIFFPSSYYRVE
jgi:hypothetical protein